MKNGYTLKVKEYNKLLKKQKKGESVDTELIDLKTKIMKPTQDSYTEDNCRNCIYAEIHPNKDRQTGRVVCSRMAAGKPCQCHKIEVKGSKDSPYDFYDTLILDKTVYKH